MPGWCFSKPTTVPVPRTTAPFAEFFLSVIRRRKNLPGAPFFSLPVPKSSMPMKLFHSTRFACSCRARAVPPASQREISPCPSRSAPRTRPMLPDQSARTHLLQASFISLGGLPTTLAKARTPVGSSTTLSRHAW